MSQRLGPRVRLRARGEFTLVQKQGRRVATTYMTVLALPNSLDRDRLGIIASRRLGGAVTRNRAKRRLREIFRHQDPDTAGSRGVRPLDLVVIPRRELLAASYDAVESDFVGALARLDRARRP
jgi:ribonuclease P protein component